MLKLSPTSLLHGVKWGQTMWRNGCSPGYLNLQIGLKLVSGDRNAGLKAPAGVLNAGPVGTAWGEEGLISGVAGALPSLGPSLYACLIQTGWSSGGKLEAAKTTCWRRA